MKHPLALAGLILTLCLLLPGCRGDRENPTAKTEADRVMASYLTSVQKIGQLLADVQSEDEAKAASPKVLLIVQDMRDLMPRTRQITRKEQADAMSKYRVKTKTVNRQFAKDIVHFISIPGASEDLIRQLKSLPPVFPPVLTPEFIPPGSVSAD